MEEIDGSWITHGLEWDDPYRIRNTEELLNYINQVGFLPLFSNEVEGFSVEDHVSPLYWWSGDREQDPWEWREILTAGGQVMYGKFFNRKAGFISKEWFPVFANFRRDGYDFDARWEDELASHRAKKIMDVFEAEEELYSFEVKEKAGFGKGGEKNFEGTITELQMQAYLTVCDFRRKKRKKDGREYGWPISVYTRPEHLLGYDVIARAYREDPKVSMERIYERIRQEYPEAEADAIRRVMKGLQK